ncbi:MAG TPA: hypothetical protein VFH68_15120 [Polyangia bacterium]|jgi:hypothetical protein|nr:hypothetical protein [Polyangia bacterium]
MTTTTMMGRWRYQLVAMALLAVGLPAAGCGRGLFGISSSDHRDASAAEVDPDPVPAGASVCFADHPPACDQTCRDATRILWKNCGKCHGHPNTAHGLPPWDFVMDLQKMVMATWTREDVLPIHFVLPGDPANSAVYIRAVIRKDMPPQFGDGVPSLPRVSDSDGQILHDWIAGCLGADPVDAGGSPSPDARADGPRFDAGTYIQGAPVICPVSPPSGGCLVEHQNCLYPTQTCLCTGGSWQCLACPAGQPAIGTDCAVTATVNGQGVAHRCAYGSVSCSCDRDRAPGSQWGCGVCPASRPDDGAACGNASFSCAYGNATCECSSSGWSCVSDLGCPASAFGTQWFSCYGTNACAYPDSDQFCACSAGRWGCSCPASLPVEGSSCVPLFPATECTFGEQTCTCAGFNAWHCTSTCPTSRPVAGAPCSSALSCTYDGGLCYCDGSQWQCS